MWKGLRCETEFEAYLVEGERMKKEGGVLSQVIRNVIFQVKGKTR